MKPPFIMAMVRGRLAIATSLYKPVLATSPPGTPKEPIMSMVCVSPKCAFFSGEAGLRRRRNMSQQQQ